MESTTTAITHSTGSECEQVFVSRPFESAQRPTPPHPSVPRAPGDNTMSDLEIERELASLFSRHRPAPMHGGGAQQAMRAMRRTPIDSERCDRADHAQRQPAVPLAAEVGGTIKVMRNVLAQKRDVQVSHRTGMPEHLDITSNAAAMAMDILALSKETEFLNDESLRNGIWTFVVPSLMQQRESESAKFYQIVHYLMLKDSSLMLRGLDFLLFLLGYFRSWESSSKKILQLHNFLWNKKQRQRMFPNLVATVFEADRCNALILASREFVKEQSMIHVRMAALYQAFKKLYKAGGKNPVPHYRQNNRKLVKLAFRNNMLYWDRQQRYERKAHAGSEQ